MRIERKLIGVFVGMILALAVAGAAMADQVTLKNGDRLTGTIKKADDKTIVITTDYAGDLTVKLDAVQSISSAEPMHVALKNGQTVTGTLNTSADTMTIVPPAAAPQTMAMANVTAIRNDTEEAAYEKSIHPGFTDNWDVGANVGYALTRGNSETTSLALAFTAVRQTQNDKLSAYANSVYATNDAPGANPSTTADLIQGGMRYDHNLTKKIFGFGAGDFTSNSLQDLNLRSALTAGLGYHVIANPATTFDVLLGAGYTHESYTTITNNLANAMAGEEFMHKINKITTLTESAYFYPDLNKTGEYRGNGNFGSVTKLNKWLGWQLSFADIYVSNPPVGTKQNDVLFTTGLNIAFSTK